MFDFGFTELVLILIVTILIVPPKDLPRLFQTLGQWYRRLTTLYHGFMNEIQEITDEAKDMIESPIDTIEFGKTKKATKQK